MAVLEGAAELLAAWGLGGQATLTARHGTNNQTFAVASDGQRFALRISANLSAAQVEAEHRLLSRLRQASLPFAVPEPVPTFDGTTWVHTAGGPATLCRWLPGVRPDLSRPAALESFGRAIAILSQALARVPLRDAPNDWRGEPLAVHPDQPRLRELRQALAAAGLDREQAMCPETAAERVTAGWASVHGGLPVQVVHGDVGGSNTLVHERSGAVTALLDFEIAGADFRVQDLVVGLLHSGALEGAGWRARTSALAGGFCAVVPLGQAEVDAVPDMLLGRRLGSVLWRAGRWQRGQASIGEVIGRVRELDATSRWLAGHADELRSLLASVGGPTGTGPTAAWCGTTPSAP